MLIFWKLEYCRLAAMDSSRVSNSTPSISDATEGCVGNIHDCSSDAIDDGLSLFMDGPLRRMLAGEDPLTLSALRTSAVSTPPKRSENCGTGSDFNRLCHYQ
ncbi:hypothetical protein L6164_006683 [Bauhinia variegata]|uniref:Uncharacterized protein n=1 Tax=Bauhinia variegata TaxID=167791 RepID=A0ACB9PV94_BAUVA|nr:hypothetical protein L6164_006683 [Bauhinia variegata]